MEFGFFDCFGELGVFRRKLSAGPAKSKVNKKLHFFKRLCFLVLRFVATLSRLGTIDKKKFTLPTHS